MISLRDLRLTATSWRDAATFEPPAVDHYQIADDCLDGAPSHVAIVELVGDTLVPLTYAELDRHSGRVANLLVARGVGVGDRVAIKLSQGIDMAIAVIAVLRAGAVVMPLSNVLAAPGLRHRTEDGCPRLVIARGTEDERSLFAELDVPLLATERHGAEPGMVEIAASCASAPADDVSRSAERPALLLYTSGTTGKPKGVLQAQRFLLGHHAVDLAFDHIRGDDVAYSPVDWTWAGGMMLGLLVPLAHGITVLAHREPRFDPHEAVALMTRANVSIGLMPPTVLRMLRHSGALQTTRGTRLRCFITGAEAVEPELIEWATSLGLSVNNAYGQTEANALVGHAATLGALDQRSMGRPYPGHVVDVLDDELRPAADGEQGQLAVRADDLVCMLEYWNAPDATAAKIRKGWLLTGDIVQRGADGTLRFSGRSDDIIKSGAYRIGPAEVERAILQLPDVADCAVVGVPDPIRGQTVAAIITLRAGAKPGEHLDESIRQSVREGVGAYAYPRRIDVVDTLPRTSTNKVDRAAVRNNLARGGA